MLGFYMAKLVIQLTNSKPESKFCYPIPGFYPKGALSFIAQYFQRFLTFNLPHLGEKAADSQSLHLYLGTMNLKNS